MTQRFCMERSFCLTDKRYAGDNRLIILKRRYRRNCLAPRCRLTPSWGCRRSQGFGCSPIKGVRELGLDRRESGWPLSTINERTEGNLSSYERSGYRKASGVALNLKNLLHSYAFRT